MSSLTQVVHIKQLETYHEYYYKDAILLIALFAKWKYNYIFIYVYNILVYRLTSGFVFSFSTSFFFPILFATFISTFSNDFEIKYANSLNESVRNIIKKIIKIWWQFYIIARILLATKPIRFYVKRILDYYLYKMRIQ